MYWSKPRTAVYGDGWKIDDRHTVICLDPEDGEMGIKVGGKIVCRGILPECDADRLAPAIHRAIRALTERRPASPTTLSAE